MAGRSILGGALKAAALFAMPSLVLAESSGMTVGENFSFSAESLPKPYSRPPVGFVAPAMARPSGALPHVLKDFHVNVFADGLNGPREMTVGADGTVYVSETREG